LIFIGTAGYSYRDWIGPYYPPGTASDKMLELYAAEFFFVEVNATYYRLPDWKMIKSMERKTPPGFQFVIKAHESITHQYSQDYLTNCRKFKQALQPLDENEKLGGILAQFPYSFQNNEANRKYLLALKEAFSPFPLIVEFRRRDWQQEAVFMLLKENSIAYTCVDEPQLKGLMSPLAIRTAQLAYLRFHGRNYTTWWNHKKPYERYNYLYSHEELTEWVPKIKAINQGAAKLFISFNNHFQAQAVANARMMQKILKKAELQNDKILP